MHRVIDKIGASHEAATVWREPSAKVCPKRFDDILPHHLHIVIAIRTTLGVAQTQDMPNLVCHGVHIRATHPCSSLAITYSHSGSATAVAIYS